MGINMGMDKLGGKNVVFKRKFRWTFTVNSADNTGTLVESNWVKVAARPSLSVEETEINYLNGHMTIPGKGKWESITVTYYDTNEGLAGLFDWLCRVYDFNGENPEADIKQSSKWGHYGAVCLLRLYDGCGNQMESWRLSNAWPQAVNFGELDYAASDEVTVDVTLKYHYVRLDRNCGGINRATCEGCPPT